MFRQFTETILSTAETSFQIERGQTQYKTVDSYSFTFQRDCIQV